MTEDRNKIAVELVSKIFNMSPEEREKELTKYNIETYLTVQEHDKLLQSMTNRMDSFPCQDNGLLRFFAAMSTGKRYSFMIIGGFITVATIVGVVLGIVGFFKQ